ncbi:hypothetical protein [Amycolatopsis arida]|uniref:hypothetical protein n=1 Tax=Amycolatopsis arida TaxID=587909 RepID=UPI0014170E7E|nr:hypothetical protein [Amycolatopsis arida]
MLGEEALDLGAHDPSVAPAVADERNRDPVEHPVVGVLSTAVAPAPLEDAQEAGGRGKVKEDHGVRGGEPNRQGAGVIAFDHPPGSADQFALAVGEFHLANSGQSA